jgi:mannose/fructose/N-acetylgalactosamine-specific phosphotransferase system component IIB
VCGMSIVLVRVDDRLVHGQILEAWLPTTRAQEIVVANDGVARDELQRMIMESAAPSSVDLTIDTVDGAAQLLLETAQLHIRRIVLVDSPVDALRLRAAGVVITELNLGNMRARNVKASLSSSFFVCDQGLEAIRIMLADGVRVHIQAVPFEKSVELDAAACSCLTAAT